MQTDWKLQNIVPPIFDSPLLMSISTVEAIERKINKITRKWLSVLLELTNMELFYRNAKTEVAIQIYKYSTEAYVALDNGY